MSPGQPSDIQIYIGTSRSTMVQNQDICQELGGGRDQGVTRSTIRQPTVSDIMIMMIAYWV